jgi:nitroreductase
MDQSDILSRMYAGERNTSLSPKKEEAPSELDDILQTNLFNVMLNRRSQRKFEDREIEDWKLEMIFAAADTAPTAGGFQGFEVFHVKNPDAKLKLVQAANNQPYVNAPVVLVFCMNPSRVKMNYQKVLGAGCYACSCLCPAGGPRAGPDVSVDRYDRRAKGDAGTCH